MSRREGRDDRTFGEEELDALISPWDKIGQKNQN